jgi:hypothetical protein
MRYLSILFVVLFFAGCSQRIGDFTILSTKNYEASMKFKKVGRYSGEDNVVYFIVPFGIPNIKNACDRAIEAGKGIYLTDAVLESTSSLFNMGYRITGDVWAPASQSDLLNSNIKTLSYEELRKQNLYNK